MRFVRLLALVVVCSASASAEVGQVSFFLTSQCPDGFLPLDGQFLSGSTHPDLESAIIGTTSLSNIYLPNVNGNPAIQYSESSFIRGWHPSNRSFWPHLSGGYPTRQEDAFQGHIHGNPTDGGGAGAYRLTSSATGSTAMNTGVLATGIPRTDGTNGTPRTASETRPKNFAFLACVQAVPSTGIIEREVLPVEAQNFLFAIFFVWLVIMGYKLGKG